MCKTPFLPPASTSASAPHHTVTLTVTLANPPWGLLQGICMYIDGT